MNEQLKDIMKRFKESQTSLEAYQAISDFVEIIIAVPEFIAQVEKEGENIHNAKIAVNRDKGDYSKEHNRRRDKMDRALHQLDPIFPLRNLHNVYHGIKTENIVDNTDWLFCRFGPDDLMPTEDKIEYRMFMDKLYKKILPFLKNKTEEKHIEEIKVRSYDEERKILTIGNYQILIAKNEGDNNAHEIMAYIFIDHKNNLKDKFYYSEIAKERFEDENYTDKGKKAHQLYSGACDRINERIKDETDGKIKEFLKFNYSYKGHIIINPDYL